MWKNHQSQGITFSVGCFLIISLLLNHSGPIRAQSVSESDTAGFLIQNTQKVVDCLLIRNVYLIGRQEGANNILINLLIIDGKLKLVTQDEIPKTKTRITVDAQNGFLMGNLLIGESPSFLILDQNPAFIYSGLILA